MNTIAVVAGIALFILTIGAGVLAQDFGRAEMVHFQVAVPAGTIGGPVQVQAAGQTISMAPLSINLARRGLPKMLFNGDIEGISTHRITNAGKKPVRIRMAMVNSTVPVRWEVKADHPFDPASNTFTEPLMPGKAIRNLAIDWYFEIPREKLYDPVVYDGGLQFADADTGEVLTFLPIRIGNGDMGAGAVPEGACH